MGYDLYEDVRVRRVQRKDHGKAGLQESVRGKKILYQRMWVLRILCLFSAAGLAFLCAAKVCRAGEEYPLEVRANSGCSIEDGDILVVEEGQESIQLRRGIPDAEGLDFDELDSLVDQGSYTFETTPLDAVDTAIPEDWDVWLMCDVLENDMEITMTLTIGDYTFSRTLTVQKTESSDDASGGSDGEEEDADDSTGSGSDPADDIPVDADPAEDGSEVVDTEEIDSPVELSDEEESVDDISDDVASEEEQLTEEVYPAESQEEAEADEEEMATDEAGAERNSRRAEETTSDTKEKLTTQEETASAASANVHLIPMDRVESVDAVQIEEAEILPENVDWEALPILILGSLFLGSAAMLLNYRRELKDKKS